ncbi:MAG: molybdopterin-dependent oxidoreductase [Nitrospirae bacterium]|nr:molybdopterin-dependent oxidoreductase [Nitrospirota bacterium]
MIEFTINDAKIEAKEGTTILKAAMSKGIYIPHLCWDRRLEPFGGCRLCLVEIDGQDRLYTACSTPAENGMIVKTETVEVLKARKMVLDFLLVHHPLDCPVCDKSGECKLQDLAYAYGPSESKLSGERKHDPMDLTNPLIGRNTNRCILCGRCVRVCWEHQGVGAINFIGRGFDSKVSPPFEETLNCEFCGQCVDACPVGALGNKPFRHRSRAWFLDHKDNVCPYCSVGCTITLDIQEGKILNARGVDFKGVSEGDLCTKGRYGFDYIYSDKRLKTPLIRKAGELLPVSWEEAAYYIANRLKQIISKKGPDVIGALGSSRCTNEDNYMLQKFMRSVIGTNNVDSFANLGYGKIQKAVETAFGMSVLPVEMDSPLGKGAILVLESDVTSTHPIWGLKFMEARRTGSRLIVANCRETKLSRHATTWLRIKPGTSQALLYGIMKAAIDGGMHLKSTMAGNVENFAAMEELVRKFTSETVSSITGISKEEIARAAREFINAPSRLVVITLSGAENNKGLNTVRAAANLVILTGDGPSALQMPAEYSNTFGMWKMGVTPNYMPGYRKIVEKPGKSVFKMLYEKGQISALYLMGEDPLVTFPNLKSLEDTLSGLELLIVQDIRLNETARYAHVVLPAASWCEKDGTFTNTFGLNQRVHKIVAPTGESIPDWQIFRNIARVMHKTIGADSITALQEEVDSITSFETHRKWSYVPVPLDTPKASDWLDEQYPLILVTGNLMQHSGALSVMSQSLSHVVSETFIQVSGEDAARYGLEDGSLARIDSRRGMATVSVRITDEVPEGVLFAPIHFSIGRVNELTHETEGGEAPLVTVRISPQK